jgi:hypothetical protein
MAVWPPISRDDLRHAAGSAGFDTTLPLLIRRLIEETGEEITELDMPGGSGTAADGFDGVVSAGRQTTFVPAGTSVWELSVGGGQTKANEDYPKRTEGPNGLPTRDVTYVEVILEPWTKARTWATERTREGRWKEVRGYNLDRVHVWLDLAPATTAWLAEQIGKAMPGVRAAGTWWTDTWLPSTTVPLDARLVLAGREAAAADLLRRLDAKEQAISLGGDLRADDAQAFVAAALQQSDSAGLAARTLFVTEPGSLSQLIRQPRPLVLVLADPTVAAALPQHSHQLILLAPPGVDGHVQVPPVDSSIVSEHLRASGVPRDEAWSLGALGRRSLLALRRALAENRLPLTPSWARSPDVVRRRLLLVGAWHGANAQDRRVVEQCVGHPYAQVQEAALALAAAEDVPFIANVDEQWHLLSAEDAWTLVGPQLTPDDLEALRVTVLEVLGEQDPILDLEESERWKAGLKGIRRRFSSTLRNALAQSLALLGSSGDSVRARGHATGAQWAHVVVRELLERANSDDSGRLWNSLDDVLTLLAESAPSAFLDALTEATAESGPLCGRMFTDAENTAFGTPSPSPHIAFQWALEVLAWSSDHFDEALDAMARLAATDPGGKWSGRPLESLTEILSCWRPNTTAGVEQRIRALDRLHRVYPAVARQVLIALIPDGRGFQRSHDGPRYRGWKEELPVSEADVVAVVRHAIEKLLNDLEDDPERYLALIDKLDDLSAQDRRVFAERLTALGESLTDDDRRAQLFDAIRRKVAHHREYADTAWALPEVELGILEAAGSAVQPVDPVRRHAWLFTSDWVTLGDLRRRDDREAYEAALEDRRVDAVRDVLGQQGLDGVQALANKTSYRRSVGFALAGATSDLDPEMLAWLATEQTQLSEVAFGYVAQRLRAEGAPLADQLLGQTSDALAQARILRSRFDPVWAWEKLSSLPRGVAEQYWREFSYFGLGRSFGHVLETARSLQEAGRDAAALDLIVLYRDEVESAEAARVAATAFESLLAGGLGDPEMPRLDRHHFEQLFALIARHRDEVGRQRVVHIEWQLFPVLGFHADAPTLHAALAEEPAFFAELVSYVFRRDDKEEDVPGSEEEREQRRAMAHRAYEVLSTWRRCPGLGNDGLVDGDQLRAWVTAARERLTADDRLGAGDEQIGGMLACAPPDPDGAMPPRVVRDLLEDLRSPRLEAGLQIGIFNARGVTSRGLMDGGRQEWDLARTYRDQAEAAVAWPRTRRVLIQLAESYERDARREDAEAEGRRRGLRE